MLILPAACAICSLATAFLEGYLVTAVTEVNSNVPTMMAFFSVALCIDWSFFLLARYNEESMRGLRREDAVVVVIETIGMNISVSALVLMVCALCMMILPTAIASNAIGCLL